MMQFLRKFASPAGALAKEGWFIFLDNLSLLNKFQ